MANKRISELSPLLGTEVSSGDLLLITDISVHESKRLSAAELKSYVLGQGAITASFYGTASHAITADFSDSSSISANSNTASFAYLAATASYIAGINSTSTASYVAGNNVHGSVTSSISASHANRTDLADLATNSTNAYYLVYNNLSPNGTASMAMTSSLSNTSSLSISSLSAASISASSIQFTYPGYNTASIGFFEDQNLSDYIIRYEDKVRIRIKENGFMYFNSNSGSKFFACNPNDYSTYFGNQNGGNGTLISGSGDILVGDGNGSVIMSLKNNGTISASKLHLTDGLFIDGITNSNYLKDYGIYPAISQSYWNASMDYILINPSSKTACSTSFEANGTLVVPYTSSTVRNESIYLIARDRTTGITQSIDSTPIDVNIGGAAAVSGTLRIPYSLGGNINGSGSYYLYVTASNFIGMNTSRTTKFHISSVAEQVRIGVAPEPMTFATSPADVMLQFTSVDGGPFNDTAAHMVQTGSNNIYTITSDSSTLQSMKYLWTLTSLTSLTLTNDTPYFDNLGGVPSSLVTMSIYNNILPDIPPLNYSSVSYLDCSSNQLSSLPPLPPSMSYLKCNANNISALPAALPAGLRYFSALDNDLTSISTTLPNTLVTMSLGLNNSLSSWISSIPSSLRILQIDYCPLTSIPTIPANMSYITAQGSLLSDVCLDNMLTQLVSGYPYTSAPVYYMDLQNTPSLVGSPYSASIASKISYLQSNGWIVLI